MQATGNNKEPEAKEAKVQNNTEDPEEEYFGTFGNIK